MAKKNTAAIAEELAAPILEEMGLETCGCCGTPASRVYLVSARTAAQAALSGYLYQA